MLQTEFSEKIMNTDIVMNVIYPMKLIGEWQHGLLKKMFTESKAAMEKFLVINALTMEI